MAATLARLRPEVPAKPILKWAGGKQALASQLTQAFPRAFDRYFEPFLGGASVFLDLDPRRAVVCDQNTWLMDAYLAIRDHHEEVAKVLRRLPNAREQYLAVRSVDHDRLDLVRKAAHLIYLNKTCFRGLFRVNRLGKFNVPYGEYNRRYFDPDNLRRVAGRLKGIGIRCGDFELGLDGITRDDFAYLDPPYYKLGGYADFNRYTPCQFREMDHVRLAAVCREMDNRGIRWALTNSNTPLVCALFRGFEMRRISARREINLSSSKRDIIELLITNY